MSNRCRRCTVAPSIHLIHRFALNKPSSFPLCFALKSPFLLLFPLPLSLSALASLSPWATQNMRRRRGRRTFLCREVAAAQLTGSTRLLFRRPAPHYSPPTLSALPRCVLLHPCLEFFAFILHLLKKSNVNINKKWAVRGAAASVVLSVWGFEGWCLRAQAVKE